MELLVVDTCVLGLAPTRAGRTGFMLGTALRRNTGQKETQRPNNVLRLFFKSGDSKTPRRFYNPFQGPR